MMSSLTYYVCAHCGNIAEKVIDRNVPLYCCNDEMQALIPGSVDAAQEKHVPDVKIDGRRVSVQIGSVVHPMLEEHFINFITLETKKGVYRANLSPGDAPNAVFNLSEGDEPVAVYEWCNLHGLWKKEV